MESVKIVLDDGTGERYDHALRDNTLQDSGQLQIITKDVATQEGNPGILLSFGVVLPDGSIKNAQTVVTARTLVAALKVIENNYPGLL